MKLVTPSFKVVYGAFSSSNHSQPFWSTSWAILACFSWFKTISKQFVGVFDSHEHGDLVGDGCSSHEWLNSLWSSLVEGL